VNAKVVLLVRADLEVILPTVFSGACS